MADCLSCAELEQKLCNIAEEIAAVTCAIAREGDTTLDNTPALNARIDVMNMYQDLYKSKKCGSYGELYEFVHVPCVTPVTCVGSTCRTVPTVREQRRYRR